MRQGITQLKSILEEQLANLRQIKKSILSVLIKVEGVTDEEIADEVKTTEDLKGDMNTTIASLTELLKPKPSSP